MEGEGKTTATEERTVIRRSLGHLPDHIRERILRGETGRGPRSTRPKVDVRELVKSLQGR